MAAIVVRNIAFFAMVGFAILEVLFIVGEYWADPGGIEAIVGSIGVIGTILAVSLWALLSPQTARYYLWVTVGSKSANVNVGELAPPTAGGSFQVRLNASRSLARNRRAAIQ